MKPYYQDDAVTIYHGDCRDVLPTLAPVETCITDPPYGLSFMGKDWDHGVPGVEFWRLISDALLPGAMRLAFGGTRTHHRLMVAIEDAGFELRDCLMWLYGSGFPKSLDISKAIDKVNGETGRLLKFTAWMRTTGLTASQINAATGTFMGSHYLTAKSQPAIPTRALWSPIRPLCGTVPAWVDELVERIEAERDVVGTKDANLLAVAPGQQNDRSATALDITAPATDAAKLWHGWGTALKPAWEPIVLAMKPLAGTFAANALGHGVAGLNVDGCRIGRAEDDTSGWSVSGSKASENRSMSGGNYDREPEPDSSGRWPANVLLDTDSAALLDEQSGESVSTGGSGATSMRTALSGAVYGEYAGDRLGRNAGGLGDRGGASRFFYTAKASRSDRGENNTHPTVKPSDLMKWLCKLTATPTSGTVLDPFMGSGTTIYAAKETGRKAIGIELEGYCEIAAKRCSQGVLAL